jgi:hypothetical protein
MKRFALIAAAALAVVACTPSEPEEPTLALPASSSSSSESSSSVSSSSGSSVSSEIVEEQDVMNHLVIADRSYERAIGAKGAAWLDAIGAVKLTGNIEPDAYMTVELSRGVNDNGRGWAGLGFYVAPVARGNGFDYPDESVFGTNLNYVDAVWRGDCKRHLAVESSFGVLKEHDNTASFGLSTFPLTAADPCSKESRTVDLVNLINSGGLYLGAMPSDGTYHATITIHYRGELTMVTQDW